jgi:hypothetical protein
MRGPWATLSGSPCRAFPRMRGLAACRGSGGGTHDSQDAAPTDPYIPQCLQALELQHQPVATMEQQHQA